MAREGTCRFLGYVPTEWHGGGVNWSSFLRDVRDVLKVELFEIAGTRITLATALTAVAIVVVTNLASRLIRKGVERAFMRRGVEDPGTKAVVLKLLHYVIMLIGFTSAIQTLGIDLGALFAAGAVFAVGVGFAMQTVVQNFVSGLILMIERAITPGDVIDMDGTMLRVKRMGIRSTVTTSLDGEDILVPNSMLVQNRVKNLTLDTPDVRVTVTVGVAYDSDLTLVQETLQEVARTHHDPQSRSAPFVFLSDFGDSAVIFDLTIWTTDVWSTPRLRSEVRHGIWAAFKERGIVIAFPQLDVHFDEGLRLAG